MALRDILKIPDKRLRLASEPVKRVDAGIRALVDDMFETMYEAPGIGLAAIQIGIAKRVLVIDLQEAEGADGQPIRNPRVFINPAFYDPSVDTSIYNEGCLSVPDQYAEVERPTTVYCRWLD